MVFIIIIVIPASLKKETIKNFIRTLEKAWTAASVYFLNADEDDEQLKFFYVLKMFNVHIGIQILSVKSLLFQKIAFIIAPSWYRFYHYR
jgi:hypothetical protein